MNSLNFVSMGLTGRFIDPVNGPSSKPGSFTFKDSSTDKGGFEVF